MLGRCLDRWRERGRRAREHRAALALPDRLLRADLRRAARAGRRGRLAQL